MLNSHPGIFIANEAKVLVRLLPRLQKSAQSLDEQTAQNIITSLEHNELYYLAPLPRAKDIFHHETNLDAVAFIRALFKAVAGREGKTRWGEKTAVAYRQLPLIRDSLPDAVFLGLDRDPYEMAASYMKVNPKWGALGAIVHWLDFRRVVYAQGAKFNFLMVSYDGLVSHPESTLARVCDHVGEEYDSAMLEYYKTNRARALASDATFNGPAKPLYQTSQPPDHLQKGLEGIVIKHMIKLDPIRKGRMFRLSPLFITVKLWVYIRAGLWELKYRITH